MPSLFVLQSLVFYIDRHQQQQQSSWRSILSASLLSSGVKCLCASGGIINRAACCCCWTFFFWMKKKGRLLLTSSTVFYFYFSPTWEGGRKEKVARGVKMSGRVERKIGQVPLILEEECSISNWFSRDAFQKSDSDIHLDVTVWNKSVVFTDAPGYIHIKKRERAIVQ